MSSNNSPHARLIFDNSQAASTEIAKDAIMNKRDAPKTGGSDGGGGPMQELTQRVQRLEDTMTEIRIDTATIKASLPLQAKQDDLTSLKTEFHTSLPHLATKNEVTKARNWVIIVFVIVTGLSSIVHYVYPPRLNSNGPMQELIKSK
jgi:hypothetical protein